MPLFQVDIEKNTILNAAQTVYWTNVYHVQAADITAATTAMSTIVGAEKAVAYNTVTWTKARIRVAGTTGPGSIIGLSGTGGRASAGVSMLPLFCTVRVDFFPAVGRPSRKYLRGCLSETDVLNANLETTFQTTMTTSYMTPMLGLTAFVDVDNEAFLSGQVLLPIQMRQLRRGSKRVNTPVL